MKTPNLKSSKLCGLAVLAAMMTASAILRAADFQTITADGASVNIAITHSALVLRVGADHRVYQLHYGVVENKVAAAATLARETELHPQFGDGFISEPALQATHADGNTSTDLIYVRDETTAIDTNVSLTRIELKDPAYPFFVTLCFKTYSKEDVIEQWTEIRHGENAPVTLFRFASSAPLFNAKEYWLTQFHGDWGARSDARRGKTFAGNENSRFQNRRARQPLSLSVVCLVARRPGCGRDR